MTKEVFYRIIVLVLAILWTSSVAYVAYLRVAELEKEIEDKEMIELDDTNVEYVRCTCLDRARIVLRQTGQYHCAEQMGEVQKMLDEICDYMDYPDPSHPTLVLQRLFDCWMDSD